MNLSHGEVPRRLEPALGLLSCCDGLEKPSPLAKLLFLVRVYALHVARFWGYQKLSLVHVKVPRRLDPALGL